MSSRNAQCSCGQVTLSTQTDPIRVSVCHCEECQTRTGSIFGVQARFTKSGVEINGKTRSYTRLGDSGGEVKQSFCENCGSVVALELAGLPEFIAIPVGLFTDSSFPKPSLSVYEERMHNWVDFNCEIEHMD